MSCILKFMSLKIPLETLERSFHRGEKTEIYSEAFPPLGKALCSSNSRIPKYSRYVYFRFDKLINKNTAMGPPTMSYVS